MRFWKKGSAVGEASRIFFAADFHGSETTFRKFLASARTYDVDALVFGGDLMGKVLVPIVRTDVNQWRLYEPGSERLVSQEDELTAIKARYETLGYYWWQGDQEEYEQIRQDTGAVTRLFDEVAIARLSKWLELAEDRLRGTSIRMYLCGGNDDTDEVLSVLDNADLSSVVSADDRVIQFDDQHQMVTLGLSTPTPWQTPRERSEEFIAARLEELMAGVSDPERCILNVHVPPIDSTLDRCIKLDTTVWPPAPVFEKGEPIYIGAGSRAVIEVLDKYQPMVGLHGHIHESRGLVKRGRTQAFNPGSEYAEGILRGIILAFRDNSVTGYQFTSG